ncbi:hypothetical protein VKT23_018592 [Stygiomarasmius scandens]|uniref:Uncharacterized protein n=1 Tax=Marasmiellus scandens TaxID=2682957 RepID=A0ABR1INL8_9AGAR
MSIVALGHYFQVFDIQMDLFEFLSKKENFAKLPFLLPIKDSASNLPVFRAGPPNKDLDPKLVTDPMSYEALAGILSRLGSALGYPLRAYFFRYGFAKIMGAALPEHLLKYLMGHKLESNHALTTYQTNDRDMDLTATRYGTESDISISSYVSSVAYTEDNTKVRYVDAEAAKFLELLRNDPQVAYFRQEHFKARELCEREWGSWEAALATGEMQEEEDARIVAAKELWADLMEACAAVRDCSHASKPKQSSLNPEAQHSNQTKHDHGSSHIPNPTSNLVSSIPENSFPVQSSSLPLESSSHNILDSPLLHLSLDPDQFSIVSTSPHLLSLPPLPHMNFSDGEEDDKLFVHLEDPLTWGKSSRAMPPSPQSPLNMELMSLPTASSDDVQTATDPTTIKASEIIPDAEMEVLKALSKESNATLVLKSADKGLGRLQLLKYFYQFIQAGDKLNEQICIMCDVKQLGTTVSFLKHLESCQKKIMTKRGMQQCPCCNTWLPNDNPDHPHYNRCFEKVVDRMVHQSKRDVVIDDEDNEKSEDQIAVEEIADDAPSSILDKDVNPDGLNWTLLNVAQILNHLHHSHGYDLLVATNSGNSSDCKLGEEDLQTTSIMFLSEAKEFCGITKQKMPAVCLKDYGTPTQIQQMRKRGTAAASKFLMQTDRSMEAGPSSRKN